MPFILAFLLSVFALQTYAGEAVLSWEMPTKTVLGEPLSPSDIAGYNIYSGTDPDNLIVTFYSQGAETTTYTKTGLYSGTYFFMVTTADKHGQEAPPSNIVSKTFIPSQPQAVTVTVQ